MDETIAAISTPVGEGGIAIIRVSGPAALSLADQVFVCKRGRPSSLPTHTIHFGAIGHCDDLIDRGMLTVMRAPRTYTGEDTVEINCHGGLLTARKTLELCLRHGARLAEPGEFTKRAFLNGRMDLTQAEAVMDIIQSKTDRAHNAALRALEGQVTLKVNALRDRLVNTLAQIEARLDFPEEDISPATQAEIIEEIRIVNQQLDDLLRTAREGKILREGISVAIIGRPNAGKSSLMNALLGHERAIVTPIPGTTRDIIEEFANIGGVPFRLTDTAGIRPARGKVEALGVERAHSTAAGSEIILHVIDSSRRFSTTDLTIANTYESDHAILVINKSDLRSHLKLPQPLTTMRSVTLSSVTRDGIGKLKEVLVDIAYNGRVGLTNTSITINSRHEHCIFLAQQQLTKAIETNSTSIQLEVLSQHVRGALNHVGEIVGKTVTEDILDKIFQSFCIGK